MSAILSAIAVFASGAATAQTTAPPAPAGLTAPAAAPVAGGGPLLTRSEAEQLAIKHNPHVSVGQLLALAQHQALRVARAPEYPTFNGDIAGVQAHDGGRVAAGTLNASRLITHVGGAVTMSQLVTDFGRTSNLVASAKLREAASRADATATTEDVILATDQAFYSALQAQALLKVAQSTVQLRQTTENQVALLTQNKLRSTLDQSFAEVNLSQAQLLALDAESNVNASQAALVEVLGQENTTSYTLVDDNGVPPPPPLAVDDLIQAALKQRPDLQASTLSQKADAKFAQAEHDQELPTLSLLGTTGGSPVRDGRYYVTSWEGAIGLNLHIPIFNGHLFSAETEEAQLRAQATSENTRALRERIVRDVRTAWLDANTAYKKRDVTAALLTQANAALSLAQTRYRLGLSSIVELSQAQLDQTEAAIANTNAQYQYKLAAGVLNFQTGTLP